MVTSAGISWTSIISHSLDTALDTSVFASFLTCEQSVRSFSEREMVDFGGIFAEKLLVGSEWRTRGRKRCYVFVDDPHSSTYELDILRPSISHMTGSVCTFFDKALYVLTASCTVSRLSFSPWVIKSSALFLEMLLIGEILWSHRHTRVCMPRVQLLYVSLGTKPKRPNSTVHVPVPRWSSSESEVSW